MYAGWLTGKYQIRVKVILAEALTPIHWDAQRAARLPPMNGSLR